MTLADLSDNQLLRVYRRLYFRACQGDHFGADLRTLRLTRPGLASDIERVVRQAERRLDLNPGLGHRGW